ncbi:MAG: DUF721 domain-containing protein [Nitrospirae bacterium]|nr:DUF721 domain-containing protein [Nitrospirota bacterium]
MAAHSFFDSIASVLSGIARRHGMEPKLLEHKLLKNWPEIAGEQIAAHTRPDQIKFKKLYLIAESSVWIQHLTFLKPELIEKVNAAAGRSLVTDVVLRVGQVSRADKDVRGSGFEVEPEIPNHELPTSNFEPSALSLREAEASAASVTDPELRAKLTDVIAQALSRQRTPSKR